MNIITGVKRRIGRSKYQSRFGLLEVVLILCIGAYTALGAWSVNVILSAFGKSAPLLAEIIMGFIFGECTILIAMFGKLFGFL